MAVRRDGKARCCHTGHMAECIHGMESGTCDLCGTGTREARAIEGTMAGKSFALVFIPSLRADTYLHLNRQGDHWKLRWYKSPNRDAIVLAQTAPSSTTTPFELTAEMIADEIAYPHSLAPGGVSVKDFRYWYNEIAKANSAHPL